MCKNNQLADECQSYIFKVLVTTTLTSFHSLDPLRLLIRQQRSESGRQPAGTAKVFLPGNILPNLAWLSQQHHADNSCKRETPAKLCNSRWGGGGAGLEQKRMFPTHKSYKHKKTGKSLQ